MSGALKELTWAELNRRLLAGDGRVVIERDELPALGALFRREFDPAVTRVVGWRVAEKCIGWFEERE